MKPTLLLSFGFGVLLYGNAFPRFATVRWKKNRSRRNPVIHVSTMKPTLAPVLQLQGTALSLFQQGHLYSSLFDGLVCNVGFLNKSHPMHSRVVEQSGSGHEFLGHLGCGSWMQNSRVPEIRGSLGVDNFWHYFCLFWISRNPRIFGFLGIQESQGSWVLENPGNPMDSFGFLKGIQESKNRNVLLLQ